MLVDKLTVFDHYMPLSNRSVDTMFVIVKKIISFKSHVTKEEGPESRDGDLVEFNYVCRHADGYFVFR